MAAVVLLLAWTEFFCICQGDGAPQTEAALCFEFFDYLTDAKERIFSSYCLPFSRLDIEDTASLLNGTLLRSLC